MIITARDEWEVKEHPIFAISPGDSGERRYRLVALALNSLLFHVDICTAALEEGESAFTIKRFIYSEINDVVAEIRANDYVNIWISLQRRRDDNASGEYSISTITDIIVGRDKYGQKCYTYKCIDGSTYIDSPSELVEDEIEYKKLVYHYKIGEYDNLSN